MVAAGYLDAAMVSEHSLDRCENLLSRCFALGMDNLYERTLKVCSFAAHCETHGDAERARIYLEPLIEDLLEGRARTLRRGGMVVRAYAAFAIGQLGDASRLPAIRRRLAVEDHPLPRSDMIVVALRLGDESALDDLLALIQKVDDPEGAIHVYSAIDELMNDHPPSIFVQRADELEQRLAELGQRMGAGEDSYVSELRQRLLALASSAGGDGVPQFDPALVGARGLAGGARATLG